MPEINLIFQSRQEWASAYLVPERKSSVRSDGRQGSVQRVERDVVDGEDVLEVGNGIEDDELKFPTR